jgi:hypothetical protein
VRNSHVLPAPLREFEIETPNAIKRAFVLTESGLRPKLPAVWPDEHISCKSCGAGKSTLTAPKPRSGLATVVASACSDLGGSRGMGGAVGIDYLYRQPHLAGLISIKLGECCRQAINVILVFPAFSPLPPPRMPLKDVRNDLGARCRILVIRDLVVVAAGPLWPGSFCPIEKWPANSCVVLGRRSPITVKSRRSVAPTLP